MTEKVMLQYNIYDVILSHRLRNRPGMFIGEITPNNLDVFILGYRFAMMDLGYTDTSAPPYFGFSDWVAGKLGFFQPTFGWARIILAKTLGEDPETIDWENFARDATRQQLNEATHRCFELIEEFKDNPGII
jgi:hypothetical protein